MLMYQAYQAHTDLLWPIRRWARWSAPLLQDPPLVDFLQLSRLTPMATRKMAAACKLLELAELTHRRPAWRIDSVDIAGEAVPVREEVVLSTPFGTLLRFRKAHTPGGTAQLLK